MKRKFRIGVLTGLLLAPAAIANANVVQGENANISANIGLVALTNDELKAQLSEPFNVLSETSTRDAINAAKNRLSVMSPEEKSLFTDAELTRIQAKLTYVEQFSDFKLRAQSLKASIDSLTLTSQTLLTDTINVQSQYAQLLADMASAELTFKNAVAGVGALDPLIKNVYMYNYTEIDNENYLQSLTGNISVLKARIALESNIKLAIQKIIAVETELNAPTFVADNFKTALTNAQTFQATLTTDEKRYLDTYIPTGELLSYGKVLANATAFLKAAISVDEGLVSITPSTSATEFINKMNTIEATYGKLSSLQKTLVTEQAKLDAYRVVMALNNDIAALKVSSADSYRSTVVALEQRYNALNPVSFQSYIAKYSTIVTAKADITAAEAVEDMIDALNNTSTTITNIQAARTAYTNLTTNGEKIVNNLSALVEHETGAKNAMIVYNLIVALDPSVSTFQTKALAAETAYAKLLDADKRLVTNKIVLDQLLPTAKAMYAVNSLRSSVVTYPLDIANAKVLVDQAINLLWVSGDTNQKNPSGTSNLTDAQINALKVILYGQPAIPATATTVGTPAIIGLNDKITVLYNRLKKAELIDAKVTALQTTTTADEFISGILSARADVNALLLEDKSAKNMITKLATLVGLEKNYQSVIKVIGLISALNPATDDYIKKVMVAKKAYDQLDSTLKPYVVNYGVLEPVVDIAATITLINSLKPTQKDYRAQVTKARTDYNNILLKYSQSTLANKLSTMLAATTEMAPLAVLTTEQQKVVDDSIQKLKDCEPLLIVAEAKIAKADAFDKRIVDLAKESNLTFIAKVNALLAEYQALNSEDKKLLQQSKLLLDYEKTNKAVIKVINMIGILDPKAEDYTQKVLAARKAYDKLSTREEKERVYNYSQLTKVEGVAIITSRIAGLKPGQKTFIEDVKDIRSRYDKLTVVEKKAVGNYDKLVFFEGELAVAEGVMKLIREAVPTAENYLEKLVAARNVFDSLDASRKKIVANIDELKEREKSVKNVLKVVSLIDQLDPATKDFAKKVAAARETYLKLDIPQRPLVTNLKVLENFEPAARVVNMIAALKPGSDSFHEDVKTAREAYTALGDKQSQVNNYNLLVTAENNIKGASGVDTLIYALKNNDPKVYVQKVQEARNAFNGLTAAQKKAVKYADILKQEEAYVKPVKAVIDMISSMFASVDVAKQYTKVQAAYAKLNEEQRTFIYNDYLLSDIENVIRVYNRIAALKETDPTYIGLVESIRREYELLTTSEKSKVTNYDKLQEAEAKIILVKKVDQLIFGLSTSSPTYFADVQLVMEKYNELPATLQKQLLYGTALVQADKDVQAAQVVIKMIQDIDENLRTFEDKVIEANEAFKKLTVTQQKLVSNYKVLKDYIDSL